MPYITPLDLLQRFDAEEMAQRADRGVPRLVTGELLQSLAEGVDTSNWSPADLVATTAAVAVLARVAADAQSVIDGYLAARYAVPLTPVPDAVRRYASDLARYYLYDDHATETVQKRHDAAIAFFRDIAARRASLGPDADASMPSTSTSGGVQMVSGGVVFGHRRPS